MLRKFSGWVSIVSMSLSLLLVPVIVSADSAGGLALLQSRQQADGSISDGYSNPSQWSAIAFVAHGIKAADVNNGGASLYNYLLTDIGSGTATDIVTRILAIHAIGGDASDFGGTNYLANLESQFSSGQLGDPALLNDDMFGLLALIAAGNNANSIIRQNVLDFIIAHQAPSGAFSYCTDYTAQWCDPSADLTGAALQALQVAKDSGMTAVGHDSAIASALNYLHANQNGDGGFGYYGSSDADSTAWVLMALNLVEPGGSAQATAKSWLVSSQMLDGGFPAYSGNSTTTAHALIALTGNGWLVQNPGNAASGLPIVGGRGANSKLVEEGFAQATIERPDTVAEEGGSLSDSQKTLAVQKAVDNLAKPINVVGNVGSAKAITSPSNISSWRWGLVLISFGSLLGASIYFVSYNGGKQ